MYTEFWWGHLMERDYLEERGVDREIKLIWIFRKLDERIDWIVLAQDKNSWPALVNAVMKHRFT